MLHFKLEVYKTVRQWVVDIYINRELKKSYEGINTEGDAHRIGEAFIDGIKFMTRDD